MSTKLQQILDRCLDGRTVAIWGTPTRLLLRELAGYPHAAADTADPKAHYVVAPTESDLDDFLLDPCSAGFRDVYDYVDFSDLGKELPFEWELHGARIGRQTYFGDGVVSACRHGYIESIGAFTSINSSAMIHVDHHRNMMFISDELVDCFDDKNTAEYEARLALDPKHPYLLGKPKLVIGSDVWIGARAFIDCSKVSSIGDGAVIGACAVVLEDVPPYAVVAGVPAEVKSYRFPPEVVAALERVRWWDWDDETLNANADALIHPEKFVKRFVNGGKDR